MMTTTIERRNGKFFLNDGDVEIELTELVDDGRTLALPENSSGRKFFALKKFEKSEIHELKTIHREHDAEHTPYKLPELKFPKSHLELHELLNDEERDILLNLRQSLETYEEMMAKAWERLHPKKSAMTPEEKLKAKIAKLQAELDAMNTEEQA
jgi:hypothetical protein